MGRTLLAMDYRPILDQFMKEENKLYINSTLINTNLIVYYFVINPYFMNSCYELLSTVANKNEAEVYIINLSCISLTLKVR